MLGGPPALRLLVRLKLRGAIRKQARRMRTPSGLVLTLVGGLLFACNGRGIGLFGASDHDARAVSNHFGEIPLAGFFCNGEIGPVAGRPFVHGFTASLALIVPKE